MRAVVRVLGHADATDTVVYCRLGRNSTPSLARIGLGRDRNARPSDWGRRRYSDAIPVACGAAVLARGPRSPAQVYLQLAVLLVLIAWLWVGVHITLEALAWGIAVIYAIRSCGYLALAAAAYGVGASYLIWPALQVFLGAAILNVGGYVLISGDGIQWIYRVIIALLSGSLGVWMLLFRMGGAIKVIAPLLPASIRTT